MVSLMSMTSMLFHAPPAGGVSMGDRDLVKPLLAARGTVHFGRVLMKPGKPLTFATLELPQGRQMLVFGLPGAWVCVWVCEKGRHARWAA